MSRGRTDENTAPATDGDGRRLPPRGPDGRFVRADDGPPAAPSRPAVTAADVSRNGVTVRSATRTPPPEAVGRRLDLDDPWLYLNRELSWLEFDRRVLAQATDAGVPLLERMFFLSIFARNLDEFFMVRVAGLKRQVAVGVTRTTPDGRTPSEQLEAISARLRPMIAAAADCLHDQLLRLLARQGVALVSVADLDDHQRAALQAYFHDEVFPVLTPLAVDPGHPFPYISNLSLSLAVVVRDRKDGTRHFARVKVPGVLPRFVRPRTAAGDTTVFVPLEELIAANLDRLFPGMDVIEAWAFRVTRNADMDLEEEEADDLLMAIEQELRKRRFGAVVRLEIADAAPARIVEMLQDELDVTDDDTYRVPGLLGLGDLDEVADLDLPRLHWKPWTPVAHPRLQPNTTDGPPLTSDEVFAEIRRGDLLVHHPYDSFTHSVERFVTAASEDPDVLAMKQTLYRTSGDSPIVRALIKAAERGKQVVVLVELKARFDEEANITWARALEKAGVHVVYGLVGLKTHTKTALVVRRERGGIRRYVHIGTGNYNPKTAKLYTDVGLISARPSLGADLTDLFNFLTGYARQDTYRELIVAPMSMRDRILELIEREVAHHSAERPGRIRAKMNSLLDAGIIAALYRASQAGVTIDLVVRGICALRPGVIGVSDRIRVVSIVGRYLEHARIMQFGPDAFYLGSADWMPRNLDRRVEAATPVHDPFLREELRTILDVELADNVQGWVLDAEGSWIRRSPADGEEPLSAQETFMARAAARADGKG